MKKLTDAELEHWLQIYRARYYKVRNKLLNIVDYDPKDDQIFSEWAMVNEVVAEISDEQYVRSPEKTKTSGEQHPDGAFCLTSEQLVRAPRIESARKMFDKMILDINVLVFTNRFIAYK